MYGSGAPLWGQGESTGQPSNSSKYQAPKLGDGNSYQEEQNYIVRDSLKTNYDADGTAAAVLSQMTTQRYQLQSAHDDVFQMREATEKEKGQSLASTLPLPDRLALVYVKTRMLWTPPGFHRFLIPGGCTKSLWACHRVAYHNSLEG